MKRLTACAAVLVVGVVAACGGPDAPATPVAPTSSAASATPEGLPEGAIQVSTNTDKTYWAVVREDGRVTLYDFLEDSSAGAVSSTLEGLKAIYPDADFAEVEAALAAQASPEE